MDNGSFDSLDEKLKWLEDNAPTADEIGKFRSVVTNQVKRMLPFNKCEICGKEISSTQGFHKSHTVPRFCLENITGNFNGQNVVLTPQAVRRDNPLRDVNSGINSTDLFFLICSDCDSSCFQIYEHEDNLLRDINKPILDAIALKTCLKDTYDYTFRHYQTNVNYKELDCNPVLCNFFNYYASIVSQVSEVDMNNNRKQL